MFIISYSHINIGRGESYFFRFSPNRFIWFLSFLFIMLNLRPREPSLRRLISRQCNCSRRCVYLLDEQYDFPTDNEIDAYVKRVKLTLFNWEHAGDCDDLAREFWCKSKVYFRAKKMNVASAFICRKASTFSKAHALNFFIRKGDHRLIFIDNFERVPFVGRAYFVLM